MAYFGFANNRLGILRANSDETRVGMVGPIRWGPDVAPPYVDSQAIDSDADLLPRHLYESPPFGGDLAKGDLVRGPREWAQVSSDRVAIGDFDEDVEFAGNSPAFRVPPVWDNPQYEFASDSPPDDPCDGVWVKTTTIWDDFWWEEDERGDDLVSG